MNEIVSFTKKIEFKTLIYEITSISLEHTLMSYEDETIKGDLIVRGTYKQMVASQIDNPFNYKIPIDIVIDSKYDISDMTIDIDNFTYDVEKENVLKLNIDLILDKLKLKEIEEKEVEDDDDVLIEIDDLFKEEETKEKLEFDPPKEMRSVEEKEENNEEEKEVEELNTEPIKEEKEEMKETNEAKETLKEERNEIAKEEPKDNNSKEQQELKKEEKEKTRERNEKTSDETTEPEMEDEEKDSSVSESLFAKLDTTSETYKTYSIYIVREDDSLEDIMKKYNVKRENLEEYNNLSEVKKGTKLIIPCNNE